MADRIRTAGGPEAGNPTPSPGHRRAPRRDLPAWVLPWTVVLGVLGLLQTLTFTGVIPGRYFPLVTEMMSELFTQVRTAGFWSAVAATMQGWAIGLGIAIVLAVPLGIVLGSSRWAYRATRALIEFLRPIPSVALIPLAVLVYGTGLQSKLFLVAFAAFWPLIIQAIYGVRDVDPMMVDTARSYGLGRVELFVRVVLPGATPFLATGLRIASATALILAVTAELVIGSPGLGQAIETARSGGAVALAYALIVATGVIGWILNICTNGMERRILHWHPSQRPEPTT